MKICVISQAPPYLPSRDGFRLYGANLIRCLSRFHRVDLISLVIDDDCEHLDWPRPYCAEIETIRVSPPSAPMRAANFVAGYMKGSGLHQRAELRRLVERGLTVRGWDVIHVEGSYAGSLLPRESRVPRVLSLHDSQTLRCREMVSCSRTWPQKLYYTALGLREPRLERLLYPRFDRCVVVAQRDLEEVCRVAPNARVELIPNGTDADYFHPVPVAKVPGSLVFHGNLGYAPNIQAAREFAQDIFPRIREQAPNATFHMVGADPSPEVRALAKLDGVRLSANVPDIRHSVCSASVYVCPIRRGTGIKNKVLEAMAMGMPIVAYDLGSTLGIDCVHGEHLIAPSTPEEFACDVLTLLADKSHRRRLGQAARELVEQTYSWETRAGQYQRLYDAIITERQCGLKTNGVVAGAPHPAQH